MKKTLLFLLLTLLSCTTLCAYDAKIDGIYYYFSGDNAVVTYYEYKSYRNLNAYAGDVVIPDSVIYGGKTYSVTSIGNYAFYYCTGLTSITIPNSVTSIGNYAFSDCTSLTSITIPNSVTSIGGDTFRNCSSLTSTTIPNSVTSIDNCAFTGCSSLTSITIPNSVTSIGYEAFYGCTSLTSITIPNSVTSIGEGAFYGCSSLTKVIVPDISAWCGISFSDSYSNPLNYAKHIFSDDETEITDLTIPNSVTSIGDYSFYNCTSLTSITIPNSVTSIGGSAFYGCSGLTSVTIPNSVTSIGGSAFLNCSGLTSITIPNSVTSIVGSAFDGCFFMKDLFINNSTLTSSNNWGATLCDEETEDGLLISDNTIVKCRHWATSVNIPNTVTDIGNSAFSSCSNLISITLDNNAIASVSRTQTNSMKSIFGEQVKSYIIGKSVTSIGDYAFYDCNRLTSVLIGSGVLSIGSKAFQNTSPKKVIWLTNTPPSGYTNLRGEVNYVANERYTDLSNVTVYPYLSSLFEVEGVKYVPVSPSERTCDAIDCAYDESAENIDIGETVTNRGITLTVGKINPYLCYGNTFIKDSKLHFKGEIATQAFSGCSAMQTTELGQGITSIGSSAFSDCGKLEGIVIPDAVNTLGNNCFGNCSSMTSVKIGCGVIIIPQDAFSGCSALPTIQIPQNVTNISDYVFNGCNSLKTVLMDDGEAELNLGSNGNSPLFASCPLDSVYIGRNITYSTSPFYGNKKLRIVVVSDKETEITASEFSNCTALQAIQLGSKISSIGSSAFSGCGNLEGIVIPDAVNLLGNNSFDNCSSMTFVKMGCGVKAIPAYTFNGCSSLPTIQIPQNVTNISDYVFNNCTGLKTVLMDDGETELTLGSNGSSPLFASCPLDSVYIGRNINYPIASDKGYSPFYRNTKLRSVTITDKETEISPNEFYGCTGLKNVRIGDGVTSFGDWAFSGCSSLDYFSFGSSVETIGKEAFSDCTAMTRLISKAAVPPVCGSQALDDINKWECSLYVPDGALASYQQAEQWKEFWFMQIDPDAIGDVKAGNVDVKNRYDIQGHKIAKPQKGINIIRYSDGTTRKVLAK